MQVDRAVVDCLAAHGIDTVFGIPGKQSLPLNEAIARRDRIRFVVARHETAVSHQAWGFAETSGKMAATVVVPGPGDMNAMNGLKNALNDCAPLLHLSIETEPALRGGDAIHETPPDTYDNVVKENALVENPEGTVATLERAIAVARTPPKGPVRVGIPKNFLRMDVPLAVAPEFEAVDRDHDRRAHEPASALDDSHLDDSHLDDSRFDDALDDAAAILADANEPVVVAGGGVRSAEATDELVAFVERLDAPVVTTFKGKGVLADDHPHSAGTLSPSASSELLALLRDGDACLAVGTDLDALATRGWSVDLPEQLVHVALDPDDIGTGYDPAVGIVADAGRVLAALEDRLVDRLGDAGGERSGSDSGTPSRAAEVRAATRERIDPLLDDEPPLTSVRALRAVRSVLPREAVVSVDAGGFRVWALNVFDAFGPRRYVNPGSWATMGTGLPAAIGASCANPETPVVALTGDGGLLMAVHELHTAVAEEMPVTVVVFNNDDYAIISEEAGRSYDLDEGEYSWHETPLDYVTIADGMGMAATRANAPAAIRDAMEDALESDGPSLVEIRTDPLEPQASEFMRENP